MLSANGSPIANPWAGVSATPGTPLAVALRASSSASISGLGNQAIAGMKYRERAEEGTDDEDDELPEDVDALEKKMMADASKRMLDLGNRQAGASIAPARGRKRISSIRIRQSIGNDYFAYQNGFAPSQNDYDPFLSASSATPKPRAPVQKPQETATPSPSKMSNRGANIRVTTASGLTIEFNPLEDDPESIQEELKMNAVEDEVREQVRREVAKRVNALRERLAKYVCGKQTRKTKGADLTFIGI